MKSSGGSPEAVHGRFCPFDPAESVCALVYPVFETRAGPALAAERRLTPCREPVHDSKVLVGWGESAIVLAFRGTSSLANVRSDLQVSPT